MSKRKSNLADSKQGNLFAESEELIALRERQKKLTQEHEKLVKYPALIEKQRRERESTIPPFEEVLYRKTLKRHEHNISRGQLENILKIQRKSISTILLLMLCIAALLTWAYRVAFP